MYGSTGGDARRLPLLVRTLRGLEHLAAGEIRALLAPPSLRVGHRELRFESSELATALRLGVADDLFLVLDEGEPIGRAKAEPGRLVRRLRSLDLEAAVAAIRDVRPVRGEAFDLSASLLGRRSFSRFDLEDTVGTAVAAATGRRYVSRRGGRPPRTDLSLRVHVTGERTTVAVRVGAEPLHRRAYRVASRPGALHPPLARALALLADPRPAATLLDPFCGTGTIAIEAKLWRASLAVAGSDLEPAAVAAARRNAAEAAVDVSFRVADAGALGLAAGSVDRVAANPPWGLRVAAGGRLAHTLRPFWSELDRVLAERGRAGLLVGPGLPVPALFEVAQRCTVRVAGALAELVVLNRASSRPPRRRRA